MKGYLALAFASGFALTGTASFAATVTDAYFNIDFDLFADQEPVCERTGTITDNLCIFQTSSSGSSTTRTLIIDYEGAVLTSTPDDAFDYSLGVYLYLDIDSDPEPGTGSPTLDYSTSIDLGPLNPFSISDAVDFFTDPGGLGGDIAALYALLAGMADTEIGPVFGPDSISGRLIFDDIAADDYGPVVCGLLNKVGPIDPPFLLRDDGGDRCWIPPDLEAGIRLTLEREIAPIPLPAGLPLLLGALGGLGIMARRKRR